MSTLTKVLIVLLTVSSIFVCGIVVTYVASAEHYKELYGTQLTKASTAAADEDRWKARLDEKIKATDLERGQLEDKLAKQQTDITTLQNQLQEAERAKNEAIQRQNDAIATNTSLQQTNEQQIARGNNLETELMKVKADLTKEQSNLKETNRVLLEKMSIVDQQEDRIKQLVEERTQLQNKLDQLLRGYGKTVATTGPVPQIRDEKVKPVVTPKSIGLKGLITRVDAKNLLAQISIGTADGVKENMTFHITRGNEFICDLLILDTDTDKAVGILDNIQQAPKSGDNVSTNLM